MTSSTVTEGPSLDIKTGIERSFITRSSLGPVLVPITAVGICLLCFSLLSLLAPTRTKPSASSEVAGDKTPFLVPRVVLTRAFPTSDVSDVTGKHFCHSPPRTWSAYGDHGQILLLPPPLTESGRLMEKITENVPGGIGRVALPNKNPGYAVVRNTIRQPNNIIA